MLNHNMKHVLMVQNTRPQIEFMFSRNLNTKGIPIGFSKYFFFTEAQNFYCCRKSQYMDKKTQEVIVHELWTNYVQIMDKFVQKLDNFCPDCNDQCFMSSMVKYVFNGVFGMV